MLRLAAVSIVLAVSGGCARDPGPAARLDATPVLPVLEPLRRFDPGRDVAFELARSWSPAGALRDGRWQLAGAWTATESGAIRVASGGPRVEIGIGPVRSADCPLLRVRAGGLAASGRVELVESETSAERVLADASSRDARVEADDRAAAFLLAVPPGDAARGILRFRGVTSEFHLDAVECLALAPATTPASAYDADAWRIELDHELRSGWVVRAGERWVRRLEWGDADSLSLAVGRLLGGTARVEVVLREPANGGSALATRDVDLGATWRSVRFERPATAAGSFELELRAPDGAPGLLAVASVDLEPARATAPSGGLDGIVLVSIDTLRADRMSLYGSARRTTPRIDAWAARHGTVYDQAIAAAPSTLPSHASLLTGRDVLAHGALLGLPLPDSETTLAERLAARGFRTAAVTGGGYLHPSYRLDQGFQSYRAWPRRPGFNGDELPQGVRSALAFLDANGNRPFFLFFHTYHVHYPYRAEEPAYSAWTGGKSDAFFEIVPASVDPTWGRLLSSRSAILHESGATSRLGPDEVARVSDLYDSGVASMDEGISPLLDRLETMRAAGKRLAVVLTSDHGESLGELGYLGHGYLFDSNLRVPLVIAWPGAASAGRVGRQVRSVDVAATLLDLVGAPTDPALDGRSLREVAGAAPPNGDEPAWSYSAEARHGLALRLPGRKLILDDYPGEEAAPRVRAFRLGADVEESADGTLVGEARDAMERSARRYWASRVAGNRLTLSTADRPWSGTLSGDALSSDWIRVLFDAGSRASVSRADGDALRIVLPKDDRILLAWWNPAARAALELRTDGAAESWRTTLDAERICQGTDERREAGGSLRLDLLRRWRCGGSAAGAPDASALEQLRALGYLR